MEGAKAARALLLAAATALAPAEVRAPAASRVERPASPSRAEERSELGIVLRPEDLLAQALRVGFAVPAAAAHMPPESARGPAEPWSAHPGTLRGLELVASLDLAGAAPRGEALLAVAEPPHALLLALSLASLAGAWRGRRRCLPRHRRP